MSAKFPIISPSSDTGEGGMIPRSCFSNGNDFSILSTARLARIDCGYGPLIPSSLVGEVYTQKCVSLNLHANEIQSLEIDAHANDLEGNLDTLRELDLSSNNLGQHYISASTNIIPILLLASNLVCIDLSANALTTSSLSRIFSTRSSKPLELPRLKTLKISHNLIKRLPEALLDVCPRLETLDLISNNIRTLQDLLSPFNHSIRVSRQHQLRDLRLQEINGSDPNPCCRDKKYRPKLISFLNLEVLDGTPCSEEFETLNSFIDEEESVRVCSEPKKAVLRKNKTLNRPTCKLSKPMCNNHEDRQVQMNRAASKSSLHKLNEIHDQVKTLSDIAEEQAQASKKLLQKYDNNSTVCVKESSAQTSFEQDICTSPLPMPPPACNWISSQELSTKEIQHRDVAWKSLHLQLAVQKWKTVKKLDELNQESAKLTTALRKELQTTREDLDRKCKLGHTQLELDLASKDHKIHLLQTELSSVRAHCKDSKDRYKLKRRQEIERLAKIADTELEAVHDGYQRRIEKDHTSYLACKEKLIQAFSCCKDSEIRNKELMGAIDAESKKATELSKQLQEHIRTSVIHHGSAKKSYSESIHELKDAFRGAAKCSAADKARVEKLQHDLSIATKNIMPYKDLRRANAEQAKRFVIVEENLGKVRRENDELRNATKNMEEKEGQLLSAIHKYEQKVKRYKDFAKQAEQELKHHQYCEAKLSSQMKLLSDEKREIDAKLSKLVYDNKKLTSTHFEEHCAMSLLIAAKEGKKSYKAEARQLRKALLRYKGLLQEKEDAIKIHESEMATMVKSLEEQRQILSDEKEGAADKVKWIQSELNDAKHDKEVLDKENKILYKENIRLEEKCIGAEEACRHLEKKLEEQAKMAKLALFQLCDKL